MAFLVLLVHLVLLEHLVAMVSLGLLAHLAHLVLPASKVNQEACPTTTQRMAVRR